jgi:xanthine dehydrogenase accessory factor
VLLLRKYCRPSPTAVNSKLTIAKFDQWRAKSLPIALVTVFETIGSTYSKAGHRILISDSGDYQGLVSGGCLEGDLAERAQEVFASAKARTVTYDLRDEADELFGLGVGCNGLLRMIIQPLLANTGYEPFASMAEAMLSRESAGVATVIDSHDPVLVPGSTLIHRGRYQSIHAVPESSQVELTSGCEAAIAAREARLSVLSGGGNVLYAPLKSVPRLLVLGAGIDAIPLVSMASVLGWRVTVADHRDAYLEMSRFAAAESLLSVNPAELGNQVEVDDFDAVVVMSHHLATDASYLRQLASASCPYVGVLGPPARREKLLDALSASNKQFRSGLRGPVGLDIGADSPESIALSILAEIQQVLNLNSGPTRRRETRS